MFSKALSVFCVVSAAAVGMPSVSLWPVAAAWAGSDTDNGPAAAPGDEDDADDDAGSPDFAPPDVGRPGAPQPGGMPPLPLMPGYPGGSPFDGGAQGGPPLPFMPGYPGGSPFGAGGAPPQLGAPPPPGE